MEEKKEIFLGQKESVARYNLDTQTVTWSTQVKGTPSLISVYKDHLIVQGLNKWGTKYIQHCLEASSGKLLWFSEEFKLKDVCSNYYRMGTGVILPPHKDTYILYKKLFNCSLDDIERVIIFLEDWQSGHYFEIEKTLIVEWIKGDYVWWKSDTKHMAANIGVTKRYTLQLTGHH